MMRQVVDAATAIEAGACSLTQPHLPPTPKFIFSAFGSALNRAVR